MRPRPTDIVYLRSQLTLEPDPRPRGCLLFETLFFLGVFQIHGVAFDNYWPGCLGGAAVICFAGRFEICCFVDACIVIIGMLENDCNWAMEFETGCFLSIHLFVCVSISVRFRELNDGFIFVFWKVSVFIRM